jgi:hypothetical protein
MIKLTIKELNDIAFDKGYLPYEFFTEVDAAEVVALLLQGKKVYRTEHGYFTEM